MKLERKTMPLVILGSQAFLLLLYFVFGVTVYYARGTKYIKESCYELYEDTSSYMRYMWILYILITPFDIPFYVIAVSEYFEELQFVQRMLKNEKNEPSRVALVILRIFIFLTSVIVVWVADDLAQLIAIGGALMSIGLCFCPVSMF